MNEDRIECSDCGCSVDPGGDTPATRAPCSKCGGTRRAIYASVAVSVVARDGLGLTAKRPGDRRPYIEDRALPSYSRILDKLVLREQIIDRENDRYFERVTEYETGEVIHRSEEPLTEHRGHGATRKAKTGSDR